MTPAERVKVDLELPPSTDLLQLLREIVYFCDRAGMTDDCWRHRLGALRRAVAQ